MSSYTVSEDVRAAVLALAKRAGANEQEVAMLLGLIVNDMVSAASGRHVEGAKACGSGISKVSSGNGSNTDERISLAGESICVVESCTFLQPRMKCDVVVDETRLVLRSTGKQGEHIRSFPHCAYAGRFFVKL